MEDTICPACEIMLPAADICPAGALIESPRPPPRRHRAAPSALVDIQPVALGGTATRPGRRCAAAQGSPDRTVGKLIHCARWRRETAPAHLLRDGLRADRLSGEAMLILDPHAMKYLLVACAQLHASGPSLHRFSTSLSASAKRQCTTSVCRCLIGRRVDSVLN